MLSEAWVLRRGIGGVFELRREDISFPPPAFDEVLVAPLFGCWEGNMHHAIQGVPADLLHLRGEQRLVLGNAGVVQVIEPGSANLGLAPGDNCLVVCGAEWDARGYPQRIYAYDAPGTIGLLAKRTKLHYRQLIRVPAPSRIALEDWAAFSLRYVTAWSNWRAACHSWARPGFGSTPPFVFGWGGGVALAELDLARRAGAKAWLFTSRPARAKLARSLGIEALDRAELASKGENWLREEVRSLTDGAGASVFIDNVGGTAFRLAASVLGRHGVIATSGWKTGGITPISRPVACIARQVHVFTHYASCEEARAAVDFAEPNSWFPRRSDPVWSFDDIPSLASQYGRGEIEDYFPVFEVNKR